MLLRIHGQQERHGKAARRLFTLSHTNRVHGNDTTKSGVTYPSNRRQMCLMRRVAIADLTDPHTVSFQPLPLSLNPRLPANFHSTNPPNRLRTQSLARHFEATLLGTHTILTPLDCTCTRIDGAGDKRER